MLVVSAPWMIFWLIFSNETAVVLIKILHLLNLIFVLCGLCSTYFGLQKGEGVSAKATEEPSAGEDVAVTSQRKLDFGAQAEEDEEEFEDAVEEEGEKAEKEEGEEEKGRGLESSSDDDLEEEEEEEDIQTVYT
jgi:hypothetical protein